MFKFNSRAVLQTIICGTASIVFLPTLAAHAGNVNHVLIISVDGFDNTVLNNTVLQSYMPNIMGLKAHGITYTNATTTSPSDSFPGTTAILSGANPATAGVYYDDTYSRTATAPIALGGNAASSPGTEVQYAENIDYSNADGTWNISGGGYASGNTSTALVTGNYGKASIDPTQLIQNCSGGTCTPVQPWQLLQNGVNTIYNVASNAGLTTAFSDKHAGAYTIAEGPGGNSIGTVFSPEINASMALIDSTTGKQINLQTATAAQLHLQGTKLIDALSSIYQANPNNYTLAQATSSTQLTIAYDSFKANGVAGEYLGKNPVTGTTGNPTPNLNYLNFQAVSVAEKALNGGIDNTGPDPLTNPKAVGNIPPGGPTDALIAAVQAVDTSIGSIIANLPADTQIVLTAKHGQNPIGGVGTLLSDKLIPDAIDFHLGDTSAVAQATQDDVSLVWLKDQSKIANVTAYLQSLTGLALCNATSTGSTSAAPSCNPGILHVYSGADAAAVGLTSAMTPVGIAPDLFIQIVPGNLFVGNPANGKKIAEHGGIFTLQDTSVPIIVADAGIAVKQMGTIVSSAVTTTQIAPTVIANLGLDPKLLVGANLDGTQVLPTSTVPEPSSIIGTIAAFGMGFGLKRRIKNSKK